MNSLRTQPFSKSGFALISVLALVSLAALTATAFLASARLERSATRSIGDTTRLNMALNVGMESATKSLKFIIGDPPRPWNFVTTYLRTNMNDDLGYLFVGKAAGSGTLNWTYVCGFTPSSWTNLRTDLMQTYIAFTDSVCQANFSNSAFTFMAAKGTNGFVEKPNITNRICTTIDMIGGRISPPVGWVYIEQDVRITPFKTNTANVPVARFAYFTEDLSGLIDADRMGGSSSRPTGTNPEEISLANLNGSSAASISLTSYTSNRPLYLTPGMLLATNGGFLKTNDLRYFTSRLPKCLWTNYTNYDRIPYVPVSSTKINNNTSYYPTNAGSLKINLNSYISSFTAADVAMIVGTITNNFPYFTNRAGGMNGTTYANALVASILDYADKDSTPTTAVSNSVGYDSYPMLTHVFDKFLYTTNGNNPPTIQITTYLQFWNPSSTNAPAATQTINYSLNDIIYSVSFTGGTITSNTALLPNRWTASLAIPLMSNNSVYVTNITTNITVTNSYATNSTKTNPWSNLTSITINTNTSTAQASRSNTIVVTIGGKTNLNLNVGYFRPGLSLIKSQPAWAGVVLGVKGQNAEPGIAGQPKAMADPRMNNYVTFMNGVSAYTSTYWYSYPTETNDVNPSIWPDGTSVTVLAGKGSLITNAALNPSNGLFILPDASPCKISNLGRYTNILELGNIFDPMQWKPNNTTNAINYANTNIDSNWTANSKYGGGSTLRIGRPEHSRFAFTNLGGDYPTPNLGQSAAGLLNLFCITNTYDWAGKININTAPTPVLAALAGGITLRTQDYSTDGGGNSPVNADMIQRFTNGVAKFRNTYPFVTPSQLAFISSDYGNSGWTTNWPSNAVFSTNATGGLNGPTAMNDQAREEWFSKIYHLTCVQSFNYRIYVVAQLTDTNGNPKGAKMRKYYDVYLNNNSPNLGTTPSNPDLFTPSISPVIIHETAY